MILIQNGTVHVGNGAVLPRHDILVQGTTIRQIGTNIEAAGAQVIDAGNLDVFPGFIDVLSNLGATGGPTNYPDNAEQSAPVQPHMQIHYSIDPDEIAAQHFYRSGITTLGVAPGNNNVVGGSIAVVKTASGNRAKNLVRQTAGLKCSVTDGVKEYYGEKNRTPMTKMGIFSLLENAFFHPKDADKALAAQVMAGKLPLFIAAESAVDMAGVLRLFKDTAVQVYPAGCYGFGPYVQQLAEGCAGFVLGDTTKASLLASHGTNLAGLAPLVKQGLPIALTTSAAGSSGGREVLMWIAADLYHAGLDAEEIVQMLTCHPARMLGVEQRLGTLEVGKDADIVLFSGHPVKRFDACVTHCFVSGEQML